VDEVKARPVVAIVVLAAVAWVAVMAARVYFEKRNRQKLRATMLAIHDAGWAIDKQPRTCAQRQLLPQRDGYGRNLIFLSSPARYLVMSLGDDGKPDQHFDSEAFYDYSGDSVFSNGSWVHHYAGISTHVRYLPRVPDAMAEASSCAGEVLPPCPSYVYRKSEAEARLVEKQVVAAGYKTDVRRSRTGEWLCLVSKEAKDCDDTVGELIALTASGR
jgi:hypothetical protein